MRLKIRTKIILSFFTPIIPLVAVVIIVLVYNLNNLYDEVQRLDAISQERMKVTDLRLSLERAVMPVNDYIITGDRKYAGDFDGISKEVEERLKKVEDLARTPEEREILKDVKSSWQDIGEISLKIFTISDPVGSRDAARLMEEMDYKYVYPSIEKLKRWREIDIEEHKRALEKHHRSWMRLWTVIITVSLSFPILCLLYILYYSRQFIKSIDTLKNGAKTIADGNLDYQIDLHTGDEIEELSDIFNSMADNLKVSYTSLEDRVRERTKELQASENRFRSLAEQLPNMLFINKRGRVVYANAKCEEVMKYKREEFYSPDFNFLSLIAPEHIEIVKTKFEKHMKGEDVEPYEYAIITRDGKRIEVIFNNVLMDYNGEKAILGIITDISERKKMEEYIRRQEKLAGMGHLAAGVAHELKNPLNIISGNIQILDMEENDPEKKKTYKTVLQQIDRTIKIIDNLLDFARKRGHEIKDININTLLEKTIMLVEYEMRTENIVFVRNFEKEMPLIKGDPDQLAQVFLNLINNARDSMNEKQKRIKDGELKIEGWKGEVRIATKKTNNIIEITFEDIGLGIPEDKVVNIFKPFFTTKAEGKGTGLGLSIAKDIIEKHGGKIELENKVGEGVRFIITLPI